MFLRWKLAVVTDVGSPAGRDAALRLARVGAGLLCADPDRAAAEEVAREVGALRVQAWTWQADVTVAGDRGWLAARAEDLGGADLLVASGTEAHVADLARRLRLDPEVLEAADPAAAMRHLTDAEPGTAVRLTD
ncbi:SDR family NAD(P)-dependent oxidoreductase [Nocardioides sp. GY 10127]|uniref:SDR family NAD(P)-dependent oxidoreductase n=1 Tax=Nocardioides sp. GY 10127 TaxID=2569762 RepID=UPI0010A7FE19|nr:SDR family NAD(P)-dependent oxidoreductase [Nocardioides sp. GY 10127]TIC80181.1 SDR family NAD(P)-dependent oxidoreductase [Nocardioides sp. GY 10127]